MKAGWEEQSLGDLLAVLRNGINCKQNKSRQGDRVSRIESISNATFDIDRVGYTELSPKDRARYRLQVGDILFSHINSPIHVGKTARFDRQEPVYHGINLLLMRPNEVITSEYLELALKHLFQSGYWQKTCKQSVNQASVNQQDIVRVRLRYPRSIPEQRRIVAILDEAFAGIATARANAEKNLRNARELFESHLNAVFTQRGEGWMEKPLGDICEMYQPKTIGTKDLVPNGLYSVFGANGIIGRYDKFNHEEPQLLITCRGATCGAVNISDPKSWITGNAMVVRPRDRTLDLKFLEFAFRGGLDVSPAITGAAQPQITRTNLAPLKLPFPASMAEQQELAQRFEALATETQRLEGIYRRKIEALDELKKALLDQAFRGEL